MQVGRVRRESVEGGEKVGKNSGWMSPLPVETDYSPQPENEHCVQGADRYG